MAYQPKSYRKFIAGAATAAVVASSFAGVAGAASFKDVDSNTTHSEAVLSLVDSKIISGYPDGTFRPYAQITRGEAAIITARAMGLLDGKNIPANPFSDVSKNQVAYEAIVKLAAKDVISGYNGGTFRPYENITRAESAKLAALAFGYTAADGNTKFTDVNPNSALAPYIDVLADHKIILGKDNGTFGPNDDVRRNDFAAYFHRAYLAQNGGNNGGITDPEPPIVVKSAVTITEADELGNSVVNGTHKKYTIKVTNPEAPDKGVPNVEVDVTFKENLNTNGLPQNNIYVLSSDLREVVPYQANDNTQRTVKVTTNHKGEATLIITGANGSVTPIAFLDGSNQEWDTKGGIKFENKDGRFDSKYEYYAQAKKVTFGPEKYTIDVVRKGDKFAAIKDDTNKDKKISGDEFNGRKYEILVKDKNGNAYNGIVNVAVDALVDRDGTNDYTDARILVDGKEHVKTTVRTDSNGKAEITLVSSTENDSARPVVWIDHNFSNNPQGVGILDDNDSKSGNVEYTNFQKPYVGEGKAGATLRTVDVELGGNEGVGFNLVLLNQSGKPFSPNALEGYNKARVVFTIVNDGPNPIYIDTLNRLEDVKATAGVDYLKDVDNGTFIVQSKGRITISGDITNDYWKKVKNNWVNDDNDDYLVKVYTNDGDAKVTVNASGVITNDTDPRSQSIHVEAGPLTETVTSTGKFGGTTANNPATGKDSNDPGDQDDQVVVTFNEEVKPNGTNSFDFDDFSLATASGNTIKPSKVEYGKKSTNTQEDVKTQLVLTFTDAALDAATKLEYDGGKGNSGVYLIDKHGSKVRNFSVNVSSAK